MGEDSGHRGIDFKQYGYKATSNLVLQQDRRTRGRAPAPGTDEVIALQVGSLDGSMGDRLEADARTLRSRSGEKNHSRSVLSTARILKDGGTSYDDPRPASQGRNRSSGHSKDIVAAADELGLDSNEVYYVPKTQVSQMAFEGVLAFVMSKMGDHPRDVLRDAAEDSLAILKDATLRDTDRKALVENTLSVRLSDDEFARLNTFGRQIKDFGEESDITAEKAMKDEGRFGKDLSDGGYIDEEQGVAVVFDDDDETDQTGPFSTGLGATDDAQYVDHVIEADDESVDGDDRSSFAGLNLSSEKQLAVVPISSELTSHVVMDARTSTHLEEQEQQSSQNLGREGQLDMFSDDPIVVTRSLGKRSRSDEADVFPRNEDPSSGSPALVPHEVDAYWLQRRLSSYYEDAQECQDIAEKALGILAGSGVDRSRENRLVLLLDYDKFDLVKFLLRNRATIVFCVKRARAKTSEERAAVEREMMNDNDGVHILSALRAIESFGNPKDNSGADKMSADAVRKISKRPRSTTFELDSAGKSPLAVSDSSKAAHTGDRGGVVSQKLNGLRVLDLDDLSFTEGNHLMSTKEFRLSGSVHQTYKDYEEWHVPASRVKEVPGAQFTRRVLVSELPDWAQPAFPNTSTFNIVQSRVFSCAFCSDENMLLCAPTGAGKTNVAMLAILRAVRNSMGDNGTVARLDTFKVIYIAPMKALVAEVVVNLGNRLEAIGLTVKELTGDVNLTKKEIEDTNVIVTTPEKWDIITRKSGERTFTELVRLVIVDEIHLLHDDRGPILEGIVARTVRAIEAGSLLTRVVGLSATLPNYRDVAAFMHVNPDSGLFHFDGSYRPCPLQQCYVGITSKKALKRLQLMNEVTYDKVKSQVNGDNQVIVFVHSRKDTGTTARYLTERAVDEEIIDLLVKPGTGSHEIIKSEVGAVQSHEVASLLEKGVGIHHAGLSRMDRSLVEELFAAGHIKVLVSTATLAWGVNLPAHAVIIRGTQVYSPERGRWVELSPMDVMQMMGRAGRPQYDTFGEGFIITTKAEVLFYLSVLNQQLPIESQMIARLCDMLNAEISIGSISSVYEGSVWLSYTYLYVRMLRNPALYGIPLDEKETDPTLERRRLDLVHSALIVLSQAGLVRYNRKTGDVQDTRMGRVAADYYITHQTMSIYAQNLKPTMNDIDLFRVFALSGEFKHMRVREEEKLELVRLSERVPIPVKEALEDSSAKVNILLQAYISRLKLDGLALAADMVYVTQSAARLCRALLQIALGSKWAGLVERCLNLCKSVSKRQWSTQTPLRQFSGSLSDDVLRRIERKDIDFERYYDLTIAELGELLRNPKIGKAVHRLVHSLPKMEVEVKSIQPITRSMIHIDIALIPDFRYEAKVHGFGEPFWVWVEDADSEILLHVEQFFLPGSFAGEDEHRLSFYLPISNPTPPQYFVRCMSDRWITPDSVVPVSLKNIILPAKTAAYTELLELQPLLVSDAFLPARARDDDVVSSRDGYLETLALIREMFLKQLEVFNAIQTQTFAALFKSSANAVISAPPGCGRFICLQLALASLFLENRAAIAVFVASRGDFGVKRRVSELRKCLGITLDLVVNELTGESGTDISLLKTPGSIAVTTPERWDMISRRWHQKKEGRAFSNVSLLILDNAHVIGAQDAWKGSTVEVVGSRMRYISAQAVEEGKRPCRIVAVMDCVANARDLGHWLGAPLANVLTFHPTSRPVSIQTVIEPAVFRAGGGLAATAAAMSRPIRKAICKYARDVSSPVVIFVSSRRMARSLALELLALKTESKSGYSFRNDSADVDGMSLQSIRLESLRDCISKGIGYIHEALPSDDSELVLQLFSSGAFQVLVSTLEASWMSTNVRGRVVIIAGTSAEEAGGFALSRAEYPVSEIWHMMGRAGRQLKDSRGVCVLLTEPALKEQYSNLLKDPLPVESHLDMMLADQLNAEVSSRVIQTKQQAVDYLTWTFFYRRLPLNPNFYGMSGNSHRFIQDHLSELVERALSDLESSKCVAAVGDEEMALGSLNLGMIASHYYIRHSTIEIFASSLKPTTKIPGLFDIISSSSEYDGLPVRIGEDVILRKLAARVPIPLTSLDAAATQPSFLDPHVKAHLLLQSHLSRLPLAGDLAGDRHIVIGEVVRLIRALVDVISSAGWLKPALTAMELCQMFVQAMWDSDPSVAQLPHMNSELVEFLGKHFAVDSVDKLVNMDDENRSKALESLSRSQMDDVARACNSLPDILSISADLTDKQVSPGARTTVQVLLEREDCDDSNLHLPSSSVPLASASRYPKSKEEGWWLVVGEVSSNTLLSLKYVTLAQRARVKLDLTAPLTTGVHALVLYLISDAYVGECDQEDEFELIVVGDNDIE